MSKDIELYMIKPIQMKLRYPKQCIIGEHIAVQVNVVNYLSNPIELLINIELNDNFNLLNMGNHQMSEQSISLRIYHNLHENVFLINAQQTSTINFAIEPKRVGPLFIKITARTSASTETLIAEIDVKENAYQSFYIQNIVLDLNKQQNLIQYIQPNTFDDKLGLNYQSLDFSLFNNCLYHLLPVEQLSKFKDKKLADKKSHQKVRTKPSDLTSFKDQSRTRIADENVFQFSRYLFTIIYIDKFKIKNADTKLLFKQLDLEFQSILSFQNQNGGFRRFKLVNSPSNVKLTAFILRMFLLVNQLSYPYGKNVKYVEQSIIDRAALFLINHQTNQGN